MRHHNDGSGLQNKPQETQKTTIDLQANSLGEEKRGGMNFFLLMSCSWKQKTQVLCSQATFFKNFFCGYILTQAVSDIHSTIIHMESNVCSLWGYMLSNGIMWGRFRIFKHELWLTYMLNFFLHLSSKRYIERNCNQGPADLGNGNRSLVIWSQNSWAAVTKEAID